MSDAILQLQAAAAGGDAQAQYGLGVTLARRGDIDRAIVWYQRAAAAKHTAALRELGLLQLFGVGMAADVDAALATLRRAADAGDADANFWLARRAFFDGDDEAIEAALDLLLRAADAGQPLAERNLGLLLADAGHVAATRERLLRAQRLGDAHSGALLAIAGVWNDVNVDDEKVADEAFAVPTMPSPNTAAITVLRRDPYIAICDDIFSLLDCAHIIELARAHLRPSQTVDPRSGHIVRNEYRSSSSSQLQAFQEDPWSLWLQRRLCSLLNAALPCAEPLSVLHYTPGQQYLPHRDYLPPNALATTEGQRSGQRIYTVFVYLNDVERGGDTDFPELNVRVKPKRGRAVMFHNLLPDGQPAARTLHAGLPVDSGEKWLATLWIRERPIRTI